MNNSKYRYTETWKFGGMNSSMLSTRKAIGQILIHMNMQPVSVRRKQRGQQADEKDDDQWSYFLPVSVPNGPHGKDAEQRQPRMLFLTSLWLELRRSQGLVVDNYFFCSQAVPQSELTQRGSEDLC
jgi:hypothetical protein